MGTIVCMSNLKGGVGKTSTCHHLAGVFAGSGRRVLLVDNDPQASLTQGFWGPGPTEALDAGASMAALYGARRLPAPGAVIRPAGVAGIDLVPGSAHLEAVNMVPRAGWPDLERGPAEFLAECRDAYDLVLIDNPPNLHLCTRAALVAADALVVPLQPEDYGAQGLAPVRRAFEAARGERNPGLRLAGYLLTMVDRRLAIHAAYEAALRAMHGPEVFAASIPRAKDFVEAVAHRLPVGHCRPRSAAARAAAAVASELEERLATPAGADRGAA